MHALAVAYAKELEAQIGTLGLFSVHAGENGRVHEYFLRAVMKRLLPPDMLVGTGFVAFTDWTSSQTDLVVYEGKQPALFTVNDLVVADGRHTLGTVEVKTRLNRADLIGCLDACLALKSAWTRNCSDLHGRKPFYGLYATRGMSLETLEGHFQRWARKGVPETPGVARPHPIPDVIYVRGDYVLVSERGMNVPYIAIDLKQLDEGYALLFFVALLYRSHRSALEMPWWLDGWTAWDALFAVEKGDKRARKVTWSPPRRSKTKD